MPGLTVLIIVVASVLLGACQEKQPASLAAAAPEVDVALPLKHRIIEWSEIAGRFEAVQRVDLRARVTGYLNEKRFRDGQYVKKGEVLFVIDARPFEYDLQRAEAEFELAEKTFRRAEGLHRSRAISQELFDQRLNEFTVAEAALNEARLALEFTQVKAPIDGKISEAFVDNGNLVRENETILTRIVTLDPIHFEFEGSQAEFLEALRLDRAGKRPSSDTTPNPIFVKLLDEDTYGHLGRMEFIDNVVDANTGTVKGRALVENRDAIIYPGLSARARISGSGEYEALLLPEKAIHTDQNRKFVYVVNGDSEALRAYVSVGKVLDNGMVIVRQGLSGDERVVVNGAQRIRFAQQRVTPAVTTLVWTDLPTMPDVNSVPSLAEIAGRRPEGGVRRASTTGENDPVGAAAGN
jgi:multidrug efflux system membrane fusion protein